MVLDRLERRELDDRARHALHRARDGYRDDSSSGSDGQNRTTHDADHSLRRRCRRHRPLVIDVPGRPMNVMTPEFSAQLCASSPAIIREVTRRAAPCIAPRSRVSLAERRHQGHGQDDRPRRDCAAEATGLQRDASARRHYPPASRTCTASPWPRAINGVALVAGTSWHSRVSLPRDRADDPQGSGRSPRSRSGCCPVPAARGVCRG